MTKKSLSDSLYKQIINYSFTPTEQKREEVRQQSIKEIKQRMDELTKQGNEYIRGISAEQMAWGDFKDADKVAEIKEELRHLRWQLRALQKMPIQDDEYVAICEELDATAKEREQMETKTAVEHAHLDAVRGKIPYSEYKTLEEEYYADDVQLEWLRGKEKQLLHDKGNYDRKSDRLLDEYRSVKDADCKAWVMAKVQEIIDYLTASHEEIQTAEDITLARKGETNNRNQFMLPFGGDWYRMAISRLTDIQNGIERG